jgi:hypothetical protein
VLAVEGFQFSARLAPRAFDVETGVPDDQSCWCKAACGRARFRALFMAMRRRCIPNTYIYRRTARYIAGMRHHACCRCTLMVHLETCTCVTNQNMLME